MKAENSGNLSPRWRRAVILVAIVLVMTALILLMKIVGPRQGWWAHQEFEPRAAEGSGQYPAPTISITAAETAPMVSDTVVQRPALGAATKNAFLKKLSQAQELQEPYAPARLAV